MFWHWLWLDIGRPSSGIVFDIHRSARTAYHKTIKALKQITQYTYITSFLWDKFFGNPKHFWSLIRRLRGSRPSCPSTVDGVSDARGIADLFASSYKNLYNTNPYTALSHSCISDKLKAAMHPRHCLSLTARDVSLACKERLKRSRHDAEHAVDSEHLIHGTVLLHHHIAVLLNSCLAHGYFP
jgi:hypothetical protein